MTGDFKLLKAADCEGDLSRLKLPGLVSIKYDGFRAFRWQGQFLTSSLKPMRNVAVQKLFKNLPDGLDCELVVGGSFKTTQSVLTTANGPADDVMCYVFDHFALDPHEPYDLRRARAEKMVARLKRKDVVMAEEVYCTKMEHILKFEARALKAKFEGVMWRSRYGIYKFGRSTLNEGILVKVKRFADNEAVVTGFEEMMHNTNEAKISSDGSMERSTKKSGMVPKGTLGAVQALGVNGLYKGRTFNIGVGWDDDERAEIWANRHKYLKRQFTYKHFIGGEAGTTDAPRHGVFKGWRDPE